jgi:hypothetical protein
VQELDWPLFQDFPLNYFLVRNLRGQIVRYDLKKPSPTHLISPSGLRLKAHLQPRDLPINLQAIDHHGAIISQQALTASFSGDFVLSFSPHKRAAAIRYFGPATRKEIEVPP